MSDRSIKAMKESRERLENSRGGRDYHFWHKGEDLEPLMKCLTEHGFRKCRVEWHEGLRIEGTPELWACVHDVETGNLLAAFDYSYLCPPICI